MIPKPLDQIEWADLKLLKDSGREESDTIEYKRSFSGGSDYLNFNDNQRDRAIKGIAREAIAFLNGRGGDVIIGAEEEDNDNARIKSFKVMPNVTAVADRLAQSLSAVIEPYQSVVGVRAIRSGSDDEGVIIIRAPQSMRAPHRLTKDKECYVRRGRESVPMPMDEIQDVTLTRATRRSERLAILESHFAHFELGHTGRHKLQNTRFHIMTVFVPYGNGEIELSDAVLMAFHGSEREVYFEEHKQKNDVVFRGLNNRWERVLRGRVKEYFYSKDKVNQPGDLLLSKKKILISGVMQTEFASCRNLSKNDQIHLAVHAEWLVGYLANTLFSIRNVIELFPAFVPGVLRAGIYHNGKIDLLEGGDRWFDSYEFAEGLHYVPDFEISSSADFDTAFQQLQVDVYSLAGTEPPQVWSMNKPK